VLSKAFPDCTISCQNRLGISGRERDRYDLQTVIFAEMKSGGNIANMWPALIDITIQADVLMAGGEDRD